MFGRGKTQMSENDKFVMAKGRQVGNLKAHSKAEKSMKMPAPADMKHSGRDHMGAMGKVTVPMKTMPMRKSGRGR